MTDAQPPIADYALLADERTGALLAHGSLDWLCLPRFDSPAVFARLVGGSGNGFWRIAPRAGRVESRSYREISFVLDSEWSTPTGRARTLDFMPGSGERADVVRSIECTQGTIEVEAELVMRFQYGTVRPWVHRTVDPDGEPVLHAMAGPEALILHGPRLTAFDGHHRGSFTLEAGESLTWVLTWQSSWTDVPRLLDVEDQLEDTLNDWREWHAGLRAEGRYADEVARSLAVLRALTVWETGGIVAAATTSLPEDVGGERNWDYRYCWLRDSALTIHALVTHGHHRIAQRWRNWLLRAIAGDPEDLQIMYGPGGERSLPELELDLPGYRDSVPVRVGNGAVGQYQADVVGAVMLSLACLREDGLEENAHSWALQRNLLDCLAARLDEPDQGIWEMRGKPRFFTHGRVMMWAAFDTALTAMEKHGLPGDVDAWRRTRDELREEVLTHGFNEELNSFVQTYGNTAVDGSLLQIPYTGFLPADDPRMLGTVARIEKELMDDHGFVRRYLPDGKDGVAGGEGAFLICSFWLVEQYAATGRLDDAHELMDRLVSAANDVGLLSEEYDAGNHRQLGNTPQAFSHLALIRAADALRRAEKERPGRR